MPNAQQTDATKSNDEEVVKIETDLVTLPVSVIDRQGRFISNLQQKDFEVFEDGKQQEIAYFAATEQPITVALLLDVSNSTEFKIGEIRNAANAFIGQLKQNDMVMVIAFDEEVRILSEPTTDREKLFAAVKKAKFHGGTSLYDAVDFAINRRLSKLKGRKAVVLFTDGVDTTSEFATFQSTVKGAEELDTVIYTIHYDTYDAVFDDVQQSGNKPKYGNGETAEEYAVGAEYVEDLATRTGGRKYEADSTKNLENAFFNIAEELRWQYNLGYYPSEAGKTGERKALKVRVSTPNVAVRTRASYVVGDAKK